MDRRIKKTQEAIYSVFIDLLNEKVSTSFLSVIFQKGQTLTAAPSIFIFPTNMIYMKSVWIFMLANS